MGIRVSNLQKSYHQGGRVLPVLQGVDLEADAGSSLAILGSSGIGKSTLLHCLGLIDDIDRGDIYFEEKRVSSPSRQNRAEARRQYVGFVFQFHYLMSELTALE